MARGPRKSAEPADIESAVIDAALRLAAERGWRRVALADIAAAAELPLAALYERFPAKAAILDALSRRADLAVARRVDPEEDTAEHPRDRLFDVAMRRLEYLRPWRAGLAAITRDLRGDPLACVAALPSLRRSLRWMLEAAGLDTAGISGALRLKAFAAAYVAAARVWMDDDSPDMTATMARLDRALRRVDGWTSLFGGDRPRRAGSTPEGNAATQ